MKCAANINTWKLTIASTTNWATTAIGTAVTPGASNTFGSYVQVVDGATAWPTDSGDAFEIEIHVGNGATSAAARDILVTIGFDLAGGTSYTDKISNLVVGPASSNTVGRVGVTYVFPLRIQRGTSVGAKASVNNATAGTVSVAIKLRCKPTRPELIRWGRYVRTFGADTATSAGTAVTAGASGVKGSYVQLGAAIAAGDDLWFWQLGCGINSAAMNNNGLAWDLAIGDATTKPVAIDDIRQGATTGEEMTRDPHRCFWEATPGNLIYARAAASGAAPSGLSAAAYAVGG